MKTVKAVGSNPYFQVAKLTTTTNNDKFINPSVLFNRSILYFMYCESSFISYVDASATQ
jgi:hypothetical protein